MRPKSLTLSVLLSLSLISSVTFANAVDHHVHFYGPETVKWLEEVVFGGKKKIPQMTAKELIQEMNQSKIMKATVLSTAYFFTSPMGPPDQNGLNTIAENDWVASQVSQYPDRLVGFCGINPLDPRSIDEIKRCASTKKFGGLKIHLANSGFEFRNQAHADKLAQVLAIANSLKLPIVIHLRNGSKEYGSQDARIFLKLVKEEAPDIKFQIAHMGGWGGYDIATDSALEGFIQEFNKNPVLKDKFYFDISAAVRPLKKSEQDIADKDPTPSEWWPQERHKKLSARIRELGLDRVVFGTDWPEFTTEAYKKSLEQELDLTKAELVKLYTNTVPWM